MSEQESESQLRRWLGLAASVVAPATALSALLFYFGYVSSRAQYAYFGIDVDTIGLSTRDYVMRSPQPLLVPLLALTLIGAAGLLAHAWIRGRLMLTGELSGRFVMAIRSARTAGGLVLGAGVVALLSYPYLQDWAPYGLVTPLLLASGTGVLCYVARLRTLRRPVSGEAAAPDRLSRDLRRGAAVLAGVLIAASLFWATATVAEWSGRGVAHRYANRLNQFPSVILDTQERLYLRDPGIQETQLPTSSDQHFHYRYRHLRLLIEGHDRMFLVPDTWSASDSTLLLPLDGSVRVQFQFQNVTP